MRVRSIFAVVIVLTLLGSSCSSSGSVQRSIAVDFTHDEFASYYWRFFPRTVEAHPGDTLVFRQEFTGEPHTVTMGTLVADMLEKTDRLEPEFERFENVTTPRPEDREAYEALEAKYEAATGHVPGMTSYGTIQQNWAQPCYLANGTPPSDPDAHCTRAQQRQPAFDGRQPFYSSGYIPPEGPSGNTFRVKLTDDIAPGTYPFVCTIHLPWMRGELRVKPEGSPISSAAQSARRREEIEKLARPLRHAYAQAKVGRAGTADHRIPLPMGGYHSGEEFTVGIAEFIPRTVTAKVGEPVTWTMVGAHTVSFDVPRFVPIFIVDDDGTVRRNPVVDAAAGGSPDPPPIDFDSTEPFEIDGGTWDGSGFFSSGLIGSEPVSTYTVRVSKEGRYRFACLVHPRMVGTLVVRS